MITKPNTERDLPSQPTFMRPGFYFSRYQKRNATKHYVLSNHVFVQEGKPSTQKIKLLTRVE